MNCIIAVRGGRLGLEWNALWMVVRTNNNNNANNEPFWEILSANKCWGLCASHMIVKKLFNFSIIVFLARCRSGWLVVAVVVVGGRAQRQAAGKSAH